MDNSFNFTLNQINQPNENQSPESEIHSEDHSENHSEDHSENHSGYVIDSIINESDIAFTPAEITLNPKIFNQVDGYDEITIENVVVAKNKLINTLTKTNKNLTNIIINYSKESIDINNYIEDLSEKIKGGAAVIDLKNELKQEQDERKYLKTAYNYLNQEYLTLKKTYNGLNRVYIDNITNYFNVDDKQKIELLKRENVNLKNVFLCKICFTNTINIILNPCGHVAICKTCMEEIINHNNESLPQCPVCNNSIERYDNIFIPI